MPTTFRRVNLRKVLVANRGEIAVRVIRACHQLGLKAVAIYSEADRTAFHVRCADEAHLVGPAPSNESYLAQDRIIEIARKAGCEAIHPGYGFLAENAQFAEKVDEAGLIFIGPSPEAIALLGDKVASRKLMKSRGIPIIPGVADETDLSDGALMEAADRIGYPVLIKAAGGGGGKGMRVVSSPEELPPALDSARREARSAFGNPTLYVERYIAHPRHVEFQIFGDHYGNQVHLFERECSVQRRHQKIIEESPSPIVDDDLRRQMGEAALEVAKAVGYTSAGTVEFLVDEDRQFYFLEVNTRIQVEHPVTEMVVGVDLVAEQIRVAQGERLSWKQEELSQRGHAIEARLYAEDPTNQFLPSAGPVLMFRPPSGPGIRVDYGIESGDEVPVYYDPIVAKIIAWGVDRTQALRRLERALEETVVVGFATNLEFLHSVLCHPRFLSGDYNTHLLEDEFKNWKPSLVPIDDFRLALAAAGWALSGGKKRTKIESHSPSLLDPWLTVGRWEVGSGSQR